MEPTLGQDKIDAMLATARAETYVAAPAAIEPERYDFSRGGSVSSEQMRTIAAVNEVFARKLTQSMAEWLETDYNVTAAWCEQEAYSGLLETVTEDSYWCSLRLEPQGAPGLIGLKLKLAAAMIDVLLGGRGRPEELRALTNVEELIMVSVIERMVKELNSAWTGMGLHFALDRHAATEQMQRAMPAREKIFSVGFAVEMPLLEGMVQVCLPVTALHTLPQVSTTGSERAYRGTDETRGRMRELIGDAKVGCVLQFPPVKLQASRMATLEVGSMLRLPIPRSAAAELRAGGLALGAARPVKVGEQRGARMGPGGLPAETEPRRLD